MKDNEEGPEDNRDDPDTDEMSEGLSTKKRKLNS
jgi:hypothetical protein